MGSALIKSCRSIFTTVEKKWEYLVKLVSLCSEDLWGGNRARDVHWKELFLDPASLCFQPRWPVYFSSLSVLSREIFPQPPSMGTAMRTLFPMDPVPSV